ncbi:hypothetical protein Acsp06_09550 [Actinomycetospora sp. NBRC 106375]|uniref:hypothetical protein n=1 Tax=Actinomycetospora sp. NBRC 106375 TaxID=3032207 RepID=UPI0024A0DB20|nr:hypothetical protein [Actinomycetospora sp. NBRC 106375]GLZ44770.1 hypothetical protein Acsp06_09550 [Actinomycetospora sp. NBRC 106375]
MAAALTTALALSAPLGAPAALADPGPPSTDPSGPLPRDTPSAAADEGPQRWAPPLAGTSTGVEVTEGTARLSTTRDGTETGPASLRGAQRQGLLDLGAHQFAEPVNRIDAPVVGDVPPGGQVAVDVRGQGDDGQWTEWIPAEPGAPAMLPEPTRTVAVRLALLAPTGSAGPTVRSLEVLADEVPAGPRAITPRASYRVFATREGLVGGTTANGHRIAPEDQFVALPSRRALSPDGKGEYSVRVCTDAGRCATVPVWDVGPWNTKDDYWNPADQREQWKDLPQGRPMAQAAYEDRYNGGNDGFGRPIKNPAGIDLADGTFHGLGLTNNSFVTVDYLWTARSAALGRAVTVGAGPVQERATPDAAAPEAGVVGDGAQVEVRCQRAGTPVTGSQGTSNLWLQTRPERYVPAAWIQGAPPLPPCQ